MQAISSRILPRMVDHTSYFVLTDPKTQETRYLTLEKGLQRMEQLIRIRCHLQNETGAYELITLIIERLAISFTMAKTIDNGSKRDFYLTNHLAKILAMQKAVGDPDECQDLLRLQELASRVCGELTMMEKDKSKFFRLVGF